VRGDGGWRKVEVLLLAAVYAAEARIILLCGCLAACGVPQGACCNGRMHIILWYYVCCCRYTPIPCCACCDRCAPMLRCACCGMDAAVLGTLTGSRIQTHRCTSGGVGMWGRKVAAGVMQCGGAKDRSPPAVCCSR
jgi:hypothetical protein